MTYIFLQQVVSICQTEFFDEKLKVCVAVQVEGKCRETETDVTQETSEIQPRDIGEE